MTPQEQGNNQRADRRTHDRNRALIVDQPNLLIIYFPVDVDQRSNPRQLIDSVLYCFHITSDYKTRLKQYPAIASDRFRTLQNNVEQCSDSRQSVSQR